MATDFTSCPTTGCGCATRLRRSSTTSAGGSHLVNWRFNAWAKYDNYQRDERVGQAIAELTGSSAHHATPARHRPARGSRGRRHRDQRRGASARHGRVAPVRRPRSETRGSRATTTNGSSGTTLASGRPSGSARAAWVTTRTVTWTTLPGSWRPTSSCSRTRKTRPTRTTADRRTTCADWSSSRVMRCGSSPCPIRGR